MRTALFIVFLGLEDIASAILQSVNKTMETPPQAAVTFFAIALLLFCLPLLNALFWFIIPARLSERFDAITMNTILQLVIGLIWL